MDVPKGPLRQEAELGRSRCESEDLSEITNTAARSRSVGKTTSVSRGLSHVMTTQKVNTTLKPDDLTTFSPHQTSQCWSTKISKTK